MHFSAQTVTNPKVIHWDVFKNPGNNISGVVPSLYGQDYKKFIMKRGMEMLPADRSAVFKRVFVVKMPRRYRRMDLGDTLILHYICSSAEPINACGFALTKVEK